MGQEFHKRPITYAKGASFSSNATISGTLGVTKALTASSAATLTKTASFSSRAGMTARQTATTAATVLSNYGISSIARKSSAGASTQLYTLAAPTAVGLEKTILAIDAGSTRTCRVTLASGSFHSSGNSTTLTKLTFNAGNDCARLISMSTAKWAVVSNIGVTIS